MNLTAIIMFFTPPDLTHTDKNKNMEFFVRTFSFLKKSSFLAFPSFFYSYVFILFFFCKLKLWHISISNMFLFLRQMSSLIRTKMFVKQINNKKKEGKRTWEKWLFFLIWRGKLTSYIRGGRENLAFSAVSHE